MAKKILLILALLNSVPVDENHLEQFAHSPAFSAVIGIRG